MTLSKGVTKNSSFLIDNMLLKTRESKTISGNLTTSLSDHLPQFHIIGKIFINIEKQIKTFYETAFAKDAREVDRPIVAQTDTKTECENFLFMINNLVQKHTPLENLKVKRNSNRNFT